MNIIKKIRLKFGHWFLNRKQKSVKRKKAVHNLTTAHTAGIIFVAGDSEKFRIINDFLNFLSKKDIKVYALAYVTSKHVPDEVTANRKINFFTRKDLNFFFKPKNGVIDSFINKDFDILIDLDFEKYFPLKMINNLSRASFKVGKANDNERDYDLMISLKDEQDLHYFIDQIKHYLTEINKKNLVI